MPLWRNEAKALRGLGLRSGLPSCHPGRAHGGCGPIRAARNLGPASSLQARYGPCESLMILGGAETEGLGGGG